MWAQPTTRDQPEMLERVLGLANETESLTGRCTFVKSTINETRVISEVHERIFNVIVGDSF